MACSSALALALAAPDTARAQPSSRPVRAEPSADKDIYGDDDRRDLADLSLDSESRLIAERSTLALMSAHPEGMLVLSADGSGRLEAPSLAERALTTLEHPLCDDVAFASQPSASHCSGVLVGPDLVMGAAHCTGDDSVRCADTYFVFGYSLRSEAERADPFSLTFSRDQVYRCAATVVRLEYEDIAIWRLDRDVSSAYQPAPVVPDASHSVIVGGPFSLIGHGLGLPAKVDDLGVVLSLERDFFVGGCDSFEGNSGSGAFVGGRLVGIVARGHEDFRYVQAEGCYALRAGTSGRIGTASIPYADIALYRYCEAHVDPGLCGEGRNPYSTGYRGGCAVRPSHEGPASMPAASMLAALLLTRMFSRRSRRRRRGP